MPQTMYPKYTRALTALLAIWGVVAYSAPKFIPGQAALLVGLLLLAGVFFRHMKVASPPLLSLVFVGWAILSAAWADWGFIALNSALGLLVGLLTADALRTYLTKEKILRWLDIGFKLAVAASLILMLVAPAVAIEHRWPNVGALTGIYVHKNHLGTVAAFGFLTMLYAPRAKRAPKLRLLARLGIYLTAIVLVKSSTAVILVAMALGLAFLLRRIARAEASKRGFNAVGVGLTVMTVGIVVMTFGDQLLGLVGRDLTFNGRQRIWEGVLAASANQPWLGYGWESTFRAGTDASQTIMAYTGWLVPHAHSGYLSVLLQLGWIGLALFALLIAAAFVRTLKQVTVEPSGFALWSFQIVAFYIINNVSDNRVDGLSWFLFALAFAGTFAAQKKPTAETRGRLFYTRDIQTGKLVETRTRSAA